MARNSPIHNSADFWAKVDQRGEPDCWLWQRHPGSHGYGSVMYHGKYFGAARLAWVLTTGDELGAKDYICHYCDTPLCCNPKHLFRGDALANNRDAVLKRRQNNSRKTHCKNGHEFNSENTYQFECGRELASGKEGHKKQRICRRCNAMAVERYNQRKAAQGATA